MKKNDSVKAILLSVVDAIRGGVEMTDETLFTHFSKNHGVDLNREQLDAIRNVVFSEFIVRLESLVEAEPIRTAGFVHVCGDGGGDEIADIKEENKIKPCSWCGCDVIKLKEYCGMFFYKCEKCKKETIERFRSTYTAKRAWNALNTPDEKPEA